MGTPGQQGEQVCEILVDNFFELLHNFFIKTCINKFIQFYISNFNYIAKILRDCLDHQAHPDQKVIIVFLKIIRSHHFIITQNKF